MLYETLPQERILTREQLEEAEYQAGRSGITVEGGIEERTDALTRLVAQQEIALPEDD